MPYDDDELTDPYEDELDGEFLSRYGGSGAILNVESPWGEEEDDEEEGHWLGFDQRDELMKLVDRCRQQNVPLTSIERAVARTQMEVKREERRQYNVRYRAGLIPPAQAQPFLRRSKRDAALVERKKMTYYLPPETHSRVKEYVKSHRLARREFCVSALEAWLAAGKPHSAITPDASFSGRVFVFDEIPAELWNRVDAYCRANGGKRSVRLYQVVEAALTGALDSGLLPRRRTAKSGQKRIK